VLHARIPEEVTIQNSSMLHNSRKTKQKAALLGCGAELQLGENTHYQLPRIRGEK